MDRGPAAACAITPEIALRFRWWGAGGEPARIDATQRKLPQLIRLPYQGDVHKHAAPLPRPTCFRARAGLCTRWIACPGKRQEFN
jgi:hypothetical protein